MLTSPDYGSLHFNKNGTDKLFCGYTTSVSPSLRFKNSDGEIRYIPLNQNSSNNLRVKYNNNDYYVANQSCNFNLKFKIATILSSDGNYIYSSDFSQNEGVKLSNGGLWSNVLGPGWICILQYRISPHNTSSDDYVSDGTFANFALIKGDGEGCDTIDRISGGLSPVTDLSTYYYQNYDIYIGVYALQSGGYEFQYLLNQYVRLGSMKNIMPDINRNYDVSCTLNIEISSF